MKKNGFTTVELVVSFTLVMTIAVLLFQVVLNLKNLYVNSGLKTQLLNKQAIITNQINEKMIDKKIDTYSSCGEDCLHFTYTDGASDDLIINKNEKYIEFNNNRTYLIDNSNFGNINLDTFVTPIIEEQHNDSMLMIDIPIYYNKNSKQDFGIHIVYQYNSKGTDIVISEPKNLVEELKTQYNENNTAGLLKDATGYYYKGTKEEVANNFVWFAGHLWRVINIDNDNNLTMITQQPITSINFASSVWTTEQAYNQSYVNQWLNEMFLGSMDENDKTNIQYNVFNVGGTYNLSSQIASNIDNITTTQKAGLLDSEQYTKAGGKNSYLDINSRFWLGNRLNTSYILYIDPYSTKISDRLPTVPLGIRPVIKVSNLVFTEGNGTLENPFYNKNTVKSINSIKVGEYISVPTNGTDCGEDKKCLFRVVSKDNDSVKIILNGVLPNTSATTVTYTKGSAIDTIITNFANTIDNKYRYIDNKIFHIGVCGTGENYTVVRNQTYSGNVGLPVVGEIFSENDIDISASTIKYFVNSNTIENPTVSSYYWTMNAFSNINVRYVEDINGYTSNSSNINNSYGVRPVIFLKKNLNFTSGEGTAEKPFALE